MKPIQLSLLILMLIIPAVSYGQESASYNALETLRNGDNSFSTLESSRLRGGANLLESSRGRNVDSSTISRRTERIGENVVEAGRSTLQYELESALTDAVQDGVRSLIR